MRQGNKAKIKGKVVVDYMGFNRRYFTKFEHFQPEVVTKVNRRDRHYIVSINITPEDICLTEPTVNLD